MAATGRIPKPTAIRVMEGMRGHRPLTPSEPNHVVGVPDRPEGMSPAARKHWDDLVPQLVKVGVLRVVDGESFAAFCEDVARLWQLRRDWAKQVADMEKKLKKERKPIVGSAELMLLGTMAGRRSFTALRELAGQLIIQRREFGLTPASNTRLSASKNPVADSLETSLCG